MTPQTGATATMRGATLSLQPLSSFVGRAPEAAQLSTWVTAAAAPIITITGPGGVGKTRLAQTVAAGVVAHFADGVVFVALDDLQRPDDVLPAINHQLGLREHRDRPLRDQLAAFLQGKQLLLVLDTFEHVLAAGDDLAVVLEMAGTVVALVTSRAPLGIAGEQVFPLAPLSLPPAAATQQQVLMSDAGRLFVVRAQARDPAFALDDQNAPSIAEVCALVDGLPLAIELAAARTSVLSLPQLQRSLRRQRLALLTHGRRAAPLRQQTLQQTIAWSYALLSPPQQALFRRLAVCVGGGALDAAEALNVDAGDHLPATFTLDLLTGLVDHSLVTRSLGSDGVPRFGMLDTIREFALEQLDVAGEAEAARSRHAQYFLNLARTLRPAASLYSCFAPLAQLAAEQANLRAALEWFERHGPVADFGALAAALGLSWYAYRAYQEGQMWLDRALAVGDQLPDPERLRLLVGAAGVAFAQGKLEQTDRLLRQGRALLTEEDDPVDRALLLMLEAATWNEVVGDPAAAEALLHEALACADRLDDALLAAGIASRALLNLSVSARRQQDWERAAAYVDAARARDPGGMLDLAEANALLARGDIASEAGDSALAARSWSQGLARLGERGNPRFMTDALSGLARIATAAGQHETAAVLFGAADAARERTGAVMLWSQEREATAQSWAVLQSILGEPTATRLVADGRRRPWLEIIAAAASVGASLDVTASEPRAGSLTRRERDILRLLAAQRTDQEIADALFLSRRTVSWHVHRILGKLRVSSRQEAVAQARRAQLL